MRPKKCVLLQPEVVYLGRLVGLDGFTIRQEHVQVIKDWPIPKTKQELQSFLGFTNYHREYIKDYAIVTESLYKVAASSKSGPINLTQSHIDAIELLRECICNAPVFPYPSTEHTFLLDCDASDTAIGCELLQLVDEKEHIIAFGSFALTPTQRRYCTTRKELLAVLRFTREFRHYLLGRPFVVRTEHKSLTWLMSFKNIEVQLARWMEELSQFDMSVVHHPGKYHINADALSRIPDPLEYCPNYRAGTMLSRLPCYSQLNPCKFCMRAEATWTHFEDDVDYVVPLTVRKIELKDFNEPTADIVQFGLPQYMQEELQQAQADDVDLGMVIKWLESEELPSQLDLSLSSPVVSHYWLMRDQIVFAIMLCITGGKITVPCVICWLSHTFCGKKYCAWIMTCVTLAIRGRSILSTVYVMPFIGLECAVIFIHMSRPVPSVIPTRSPDVDDELNWVNTMPAHLWIV